MFGICRELSIQSCCFTRTNSFWNACASERDTNEAVWRKSVDRMQIDRETCQFVQSGYVRGVSYHDLFIITSFSSARQTLHGMNVLPGWVMNFRVRRRPWVLYLQIKMWIPHNFGTWPVTSIYRGIYQQSNFIYTLNEHHYHKKCFFSVVTKTGLYVRNIGLSFLKNHFGHGSASLFNGRRRQENPEFAMS